MKSIHNINLYVVLHDIHYVNIMYTINAPVVFDKNITVYSSAGSV